MKDLSMMQRHPAFMSLTSFVVIDLEARGRDAVGFMKRKSSLKKTKIG